MFSKVHEALLRLAARFHREEGQTLTEYGLILALVSVMLVGGLGLLATALTGVLDDVIAALTPAV